MRMPDTAISDTTISDPAISSTEILPEDATQAEATLPAHSPAASIYPGIEFRTRTLAYIDAVHRYETFSEASEALHISQPAISQALASLEEQLGVKLVEPQGRRRVLTEAGQQVAQFSAEVLGRSAELRRWLDSYNHGAVGKLTVGMIDAAVLYLLPNTLEEFRLNYPDVELKIFVGDSNTQLQKLRDFEIDLAFIVEPLPQDLIGEEVSQESLFLYAPDDWTPNFEATPWALPPAGSRTRTLIDQGLAKLSITPNIALESRNPIVLRQLVVLGFGCSVLPEAVTEELPQLVAMRRDLVCRRSLMAVQRPTAAPDNRIREFMELAKGSTGLGQAK